MDIVKFNSMLEPFKIYDLDGYSPVFVKELLIKNKTICIIQYSNYDEELSELLKVDGNLLFRLPLCPITEDNIKSVILITPLGKFYDYDCIKHRINNNEFECPLTRIKYNYRDLLTVKINTVRELLFYFELICTFNHNENGTFKEYMKSKTVQLSVGSMEELESFIMLNVKSPLRIKCIKNFKYCQKPILDMMNNCYIMSLDIYLNESSDVFFQRELKELKSLCLIGPGDIKIDKLSCLILPKNLVKLKLIASASISEFSMVEFGGRIVLNNCLKKLILVNHFCASFPRAIPNKLLEYEDFEKYSITPFCRCYGQHINNIGNFLKRKNNKLRYLCISASAIDRLLFYRLIENVKFYLEYLEMDFSDADDKNDFFNVSDFPSLPILKNLTIIDSGATKFSFFLRFPNLEELILKNASIIKDTDYGFLYNLKKIVIDDNIIIPSSS